MDEPLGPFGRFVMTLPRALRLIVIGLMLAMGVALLTLPIWRRLIW